MAEKEKKEKIEENPIKNETEKEKENLEKEVSVLKESIKNLMNELSNLKNMKDNEEKKEKVEKKENKNDKLSKELEEKIKKIEEEQRKILEEKKKLNYNKIVNDYAKKYNVVDTEILSVILNKYVEVDTDGNINIKKDMPINIETGKPWTIDDIIIEIKKEKPFLFKIEKETINNYENEKSFSSHDRIKKAVDFINSIGLKL